MPKKQEKNNMNITQMKFRRGLLVVLTALMLASSAGVVAADGSDPSIRVMAVLIGIMMV